MGRGGARFSAPRLALPVVAAMLLGGCAGGDPAAPRSADGAEPGAPASEEVAVSPGGAVVPDEPGPYGAGRRTFEVVDEERDRRSFAIDVWYPAVAGSPEPLSEYELLGDVVFTGAALEAPAVVLGAHPLVVFSHASGSRRYQSHTLAEHLASHGFVVAAPDHAGNTVVEEITGSADPVDVALDNRRGDVRAVVDELFRRAGDPDDPFAGRIDRSRLALMGHSVGAGTALAVAAELEPGAVRGVVAVAPDVDPVDDDTLAAVEVPVLLVGGTRDEIHPLDEDVARAVEQLTSADVVRVDVDGAGHASFTDLCRIVRAMRQGGLDDVVLASVERHAEQGCADDLTAPEVVHRITARYVTAFLLERAADGRVAGDALAPVEGVAVTRP